MLNTVVVGSVTPTASYIALKLNALAVPLSSILINKVLPFIGVLVGAAIAAAAANAVIYSSFSLKSPVGVGAAELAMVVANLVSICKTSFTPGFNIVVPPQATLIFGSK